MAVSCYVGLPGDGKSYQVVTGPIQDAIKGGRRVVTNIRGIKWDLMRARMVVAGCPLESLGMGVDVTTEQIAGDDFFPTNRNMDNAFVKGGDLVVVDECWEFWDEGEKFPNSHKQFFRLHRHHTNEEGVSCDLIIITQDMLSLRDEVRNMISEWYDMHKFREFGRSKEYRVHVHLGHAARAPVFREFLGRFSEENFALYSSYKGKGGDERKIDKRSNVFGAWIIRFGLPIAGFLLLFGAFGVYRFFTHTPKSVAAAGSSVTGATAPEVGSGPGVKQLGGAQVAPGASNVQVSGQSVSSGSAGQPNLSTAWRLAGEISSNRGLYAILDNGRTVRTLGLLEYRRSADGLVARVDGQIVTGYSGPDPMQRGPGSGGTIGPR